jgi:hypothetical protein
MIQASKKHLKEANKDYYNHGKFAVIAGFDLILTGIVSILHGLIPSFMPFYAEKKVDFYYKKALQLRENRKKSENK